MGYAFVDEKTFGEFSYRIFRLLDLFGHFPMSIRGEDATPSKLEKYPRLLIGYLQRYEDPVTAYQEWLSKVLRFIPKDDYNFKKEKFFPEAQATTLWLEENKQLFTGRNKKLLLQHLRGSLYARIFAYLYPRRQICLSIADYLRNNSSTPFDGEAQFDFAGIAGSLSDLQEIKNIYTGEWLQLVADAEEIFFLVKSYYQKIITDKQFHDLPENTVLEEESKHE